MTEWVTLSHDGVARQELQRMQEPAMRAGITCAYCDGLNGIGRLYRYRTVPDDSVRGVHVIMPSKLFCSVGCFRDYGG